MPNHDEIDAGGDGGLEWDPVTGAQRLDRLADEREAQMRVGVGGAVAGEMLGGGVHTRRVDAGNGGGHVLRHRLGILPVTPLAHEWLYPIPDIGDRGEIDVEAERFQSLGHRRHFTLDGRGPTRPGLAGAGQTRHAGLQEAHRAAFLIGRGQQRVRHDAPHRLDQLPDRGRILGVLIDRHDDQAAELMKPPVGEHARRGGSREANHHHGANLLAERHPARASDGVLAAPECRRAR